MDEKQSVRLTQAQFKAVVIGKGWTYKQLASHWGITPVWLSNLSRDEKRASHYDDAVMGLPARASIARSMKRRQDTANAYIEEMSAKPRKPSHANRYHEHLAVGTIVTALEDVGSLAEAGMRGCIFNVRTQKGIEDYGIIFENGKYDWFDPDYIDSHIALIGLADEGVSAYAFTSEIILQANFTSQLFNFYP